jgi:uncharacterized protein (DUF3084 family)
MTLIDIRNKTLIDYEQQIDKIQNDLSDKQSHIDQLEQNLINKTGEVAQLTEKLETDLIKNQQREKLAEDNAMKTSNDIKVLQREVTWVVFFFFENIEFFFFNSFDMYQNH